MFNEKVKVNAVFLRDSTGISDSVLLLFGGNVSRGGLVNSYFISSSLFTGSVVIDCMYQVLPFDCLLCCNMW